MHYFTRALAVDLYRRSVGFSVFVHENFSARNFNNLLDSAVAIEPALAREKEENRKAINHVCMLNNSAIK